MKKTLKDLIHFFPFEDEFRKDFLGNYPDKLDADTKYEIENALWQMWDAYYQLKLQQNIQLEMDRRGKANEGVDANFYSEVQEMTDKEIEDEFARSKELGHVFIDKKHISKLQSEIHHLIQ